MKLERLRDGEEVIAFMCAALVHGPGELEGRPWRPSEWQAEFLQALYSRGDDGERRVDRAVLLTPKGAGKTELAGAIAVIEMLIRPSAEVILGAATWEQAALLKASADGACADLNSPLASMVEVTEAEVRLRGTTSKIMRVASEARSNDGACPTCVIRDEIHEWGTPNREANYQILGAGLAKRRGVAIDISTVGADRDSLLGRLVDYCEQVDAGDIADDRLLYVYHGAQGHLDGLDLSSDADLERAITIVNPSARGTHPFVDPAEVRRRYREMPAGVAARRYFLNVWGDGGDEQWLPEGRWGQLVDRERDIPAGTAIFVGFDGSDRSDSTALVAIALEDETRPHVMVLGVWERPHHAPDGWHVPRDEVHAAVEAMFGTYDVRQLRADPFLWREELRAWHDRWGSVVEEFPTNKAEAWGQSCELTYAAIANGDLSHDGDERLAAHLKHAIPRTSPNHKWVTFGKPHRDSPKKVDAAVALTLAIHARHDWTPAIVPFFAYGD